MFADLKEMLQIAIEGSLKELSSESFPPVTIDVPSEKKHGEFSCNVALRLTKALKKDPLSIANDLKISLEKSLQSGSLKDKIKAIEVAKPGFINFFLTDNAFYDILYEIFEQGKNYGRTKDGKGEKVQIEFVSANPTGPLSVAHARQAAVGDALANIFEFTGHDVKKEFYVNDEGNQINLLGASIRIRAQQQFTQRPIPEAILGDPETTLGENHYQGDYIIDIAKEFIKKYKIESENDLNELENKNKQIFSQFGVDYLLAVIKTELKDFGVHFDIWSHQSKIATIANTQAAIDLLREKGFVYDHEGAVWFKSTAFGDDKDRVVKKSDGSFTYLAPDIVYHKNKFERGFTKVFNIWGPDHHGYIPRITAAVEALGYNPKALEVLIVQLATIFRDGKPLSMSTRRGQYISLREVITEVGVDAARFFFLMRHISAHLDFDLELAKKETPENPVYYIQYAHARISSIIETAKESKLKPKHSDLKLLKEEEEMDLIRRIGSFSDILLICCGQRDPYMLVAYLQDIAAYFHKFYDRHRVIGEDKELSCERLALIYAVKIVLANGLTLLGVSAPEKM